MHERSIIRKFETLSRFTIPKEFCTSLDLTSGSFVEITLEFGELCIKKFNAENFDKRPFVGIRRIVETNNRVAVPKEYAEMLGLKPGSMLFLKIEDDCIKVTKA